MSQLVCNLFRNNRGVQVLATDKPNALDEAIVKKSQETGRISYGIKLSGSLNIEKITKPDSLVKSSFVISTHLLPYPNIPVAYR